MRNWLQAIRTARTNPPSVRNAAPAASEDCFAAQARLLAEAARSPYTIFDVGAHHGETTERYRALFPDATIWLFEPSPQSIEILQKRVTPTERVHIVEAAVTDSRGTKDFWMNSESATDSLLPLEDDRHYVDAPVTRYPKVKVPSLTLDDFCSEQGISHLHILKMDIQGAERDAILGAQALLNANCVDLIYSEILFVPLYRNQAYAWELLDLLAGFDYRPFSMYNIVYSHQGQMKWGDALFLSPTLRGQLAI